MYLSIVACTIAQDNGNAWARQRGTRCQTAAGGGGGGAAAPGAETGCRVISPPAALQHGLKEVRWEAVNGGMRWVDRVTLS